MVLAIIGGGALVVAVAIELATGSPAGVGWVLVGPTPFYAVGSSVRSAGQATASRPGCSRPVRCSCWRNASAMPSRTCRCRLARRSTKDIGGWWGHPFVTARAGAR